MTLLDESSTCFVDVDSQQARRLHEVGFVIWNEASTRTINRLEMYTRFSGRLQPDPPVIV